MNDSLEFITVKRRKYAKDHNKNNITKYFRIDRETEKELEDYSKKMWYTQSKIIKDSLNLYFKKY